MAREKGVVLEEIDMNEDDPSDVAAEIAAAKWFETNSLSRPILGGKNNVKSISREQIFEYMNDFTPPTTPPSACAVTFRGRLFTIR